MSDTTDISQIPNDELVQNMQDDLYDGIVEGVVNGVNELLRRNWTPYDVMIRSLVAGMDTVGNDFRDGIIFVPEVLLAAKAMKAGMEILRPLLTATGAPVIGTLVIGTVKGDIHDIGKNLVAMMMEGAGFKVINLGANVDKDKFLNSIREHNATILGMSALLTTTMPYMGIVIQALKDAGLRDQITVLVGGAPLNEAFAEEIGADAYCSDAAVAVETAKKLISIRKGQM